MTALGSKIVGVWRKIAAVTVKIHIVPSGIALVEPGDALERSRTALRGPRMETIDQREVVAWSADASHASSAAINPSADAIN